MSNELYDFLKFIGQIFLPALATAYCALAQIWTAIPFAEEIPATIIVLDTFLNTLLQISSANYYKNLNADTATVIDVENIVHEIPHEVTDDSDKG